MIDNDCYTHHTKKNQLIKIMVFLKFFRKMRLYPLLTNDFNFCYNTIII